MVLPVEVTKKRWRGVSFRHSVWYYNSGVLERFGRTSASKHPDLVGISARTHNLDTRLFHGRPCTYYNDSAFSLRLPTWGVLKATLLGISLQRLLHGL